MKTITKWLLSYTESKTLSMEVKEVNPYIPLNRYLKTVGWYDLEGVRVGGVTYIITFDPSEPKGQMSHILVTKTGDKGPISLEETDKTHMDAIARIFLSNTVPLVS